MNLVVFELKLQYVTFADKYSTVKFAQGSVLCTVECNMPNAVQGLQLSLVCF